MAKYTYEEIKRRFEDCIKVGYEPELMIYLGGKMYGIIGYADFVEFMRIPCVDFSEIVRFGSLDELYNTQTVDEVLLVRDWDRIEKFECMDFSIYFEEDF